MQQFNPLAQHLRQWHRRCAYALGVVLLLAAIGHAQHGVALSATHVSGEACEYCAAGATALVASHDDNAVARLPAPPRNEARKSLISRAAPTPRGRAPPTSTLV